MAAKQGKTQFKKGEGGRKKGSPNKVTQSIREKFEELLDGVGVDQMIEDLKQMRPDARMNCIMGLAEYIVPKLARTNVTHEAGETIDGFELIIKRNRDDS